MGALPSQKYDLVCMEFLKYLYENYGIGFKDERARKVFVTEFLVKCNDGEIDVK